MFCSFSQNIEKPHQKFQKLTPNICNLKTDLKSLVVLLNAEMLDQLLLNYVGPYGVS